MNKNIFITLLVMCVACKQNAQNFNYELEDSNQSYVMESWSKEQKEDYYKKVGGLVKEFLSRESYKFPDQASFSKNIAEKLSIKVDFGENFKIIPYHIFQKDSLENDSPQIIIFPNDKVVSFKSEFPLLDKVSLENYNSKDFKKLDHSKEYNTILNKILFNEDQKEIDNWLKYEYLNDLFIYIVTRFHYSSNEKIFYFVINKLQAEIGTMQYKSKYLQLLFNPKGTEIDKKILAKIAKIDNEKKLYYQFKNCIANEFSKDNQVKFQNEIDEVYEIKNSYQQKDNVQNYLKNGYQIIDEISADLDGDSDNDKIYITSSSDEITNAQIIIFKNNNDIFSLWAKNDYFPVMGQKEYKKTITKGSYFTIEYNRDIEDRYNQYNYLTFKCENNIFLLHKFSQEIYDAKTNKNLPIKIWTNKNFGNINLEVVSYNFIDNLK